eukprot:2851644-Rhodomonas_salina.1
MCGTETNTAPQTPATGPPFPSVRRQVGGYDPTVGGGEAVRYLPSRSYAMSGTHTAYSAVSLRAPTRCPRMVSDTEIAYGRIGLLGCPVLQMVYGAICLRECYAMSGTDLAHGAGVLRGAGKSTFQLSWYAATRNSTAVQRRFPYSVYQDRHCFANWRLSIMIAVRY